MVFKKGQPPYMKGRKFSEESKRKMSLAHRGITSWNKGISCREETKKKLSLRCKGIHRSPKTEFKKGQNGLRKGTKHTEEAKRKIREKRKLQIITKEHIRKSLRRRPMSNLEVKMDDIIKRNNLPYKFVGNGDFFIGRKNPDFININGEKIALEVFDIRHKTALRGDIKVWKRERQNIFKVYGWEIEFFDAIQVNETEVMRRLK